MTGCTDDQHLRGAELLKALHDRGLDDTDIAKVARQLTLVRALSPFWETAEVALMPWCEPFRLVARAGWSSLDGTQFGTTQMRVVNDVLQVRQYQACPAFNSGGHRGESCVDCWVPTNEFAPSKMWRPINGNLQIRMPEAVDTENGTCLVEVMRRTDSYEGQPEAEWSAPFPVPDEWEWVNVAPDVQVTREGHMRGLLVRRATRLTPTVEWAETPTFLPVTGGRWASIVPDGSLQVRLWVEREGSKYQIEARQRTGRQPLLAVEPHWEKPEDLKYGGTTIAYGYTLRVVTKQSFHRATDPDEVRVTDPYGATAVCRVYDKWVRVARNLRVYLSWQGYAHVQYGTFEPPAQPVSWGAVNERRLDHGWTQLTDQVRVRLHGDTSLVEASLASVDGTWQPATALRMGSSHELAPNLRATFAPHGTVEFQLTEPANAAATE